MHKTRWKDGFDFQTAPETSLRLAFLEKFNAPQLGLNTALAARILLLNYITDDTKVKNLFMTGIPMLCSVELRDRYNNQFVAINEIVEADRVNDEAAHKMYTNKEAIIHSNTDYFFAVTSLPKYIMCSLEFYLINNSPGTQVPRVAPERIPTLKHLMKCSRDVTSLTDLAPIGEDTDRTTGPNSGDHKEIKVGDTSWCIIPPWEEYDALKEGTLVIITISIHTFIMPIKDNQGNFTGQERRVYQLNAHHILIVDESDAEAEPHYKPYPNEEAVAITTVTPVETAADQALATFKVKKARLASPQREPDADKEKPGSPLKPSVNSSKTPAKSNEGPKQTKKAAAGKNPVQCLSTKGKEKANSTASSNSTSKTAKTDSLADEDQIMAEVDDT
ncbi:uncharacterized protein LACBIDRAFT_333201 [Laccaria bicolor S238N-H82]|uniref:Predicted protein n=1 Tax=Laccaria bicolor (strain S238N-H82 / ATCC MYA-4686) TaxID=486041 RepID=B0DV78_LACBS|nr:uncharacterized protein LACBIDRAFT_333201 [Laccaria bicolor S238N-H82]EDR01531.1 predicted protein [Laccaria bicolor S238N-H82]|eukprot:XP_001887883.1 predicted protein [Laccaria bicolor S238N-H82]